MDTRRISASWLSDDMAQATTDGPRKTPPGSATGGQKPDAVRGGAAKHIEAALPRVGELVQKYAG